jgi:hypothetical protein
VVRSDGIILIPGNREDLITYVLDPKMSGDTIGLLIPGEQYFYKCHLYFYVCMGN